ncbi:hypothetical protein VNO78_14929 [Psophocarpus tetragonolobus]|uniref:Uncharacterized protein n=1 Tax=Psophocarpus tetragonolobus TaxID=3891 RepID=A0AAN9SEE5_PSOTE
MGSENIKIHEQCRVSPPSGSARETSLSLTFLDVLWLRFHPVERMFLYTLPRPESEPSIFFSNVIPKLKRSLSDALQHFPPLAGKVVWPKESPNPIVQYTPGDAVSVLLAESHAPFNLVLDNSPHQASLSRSFVPPLSSSDSHASVLSLQITLFPNSGFSIGITTHHAILDGKSSSLFVKAWSFLCKSSLHQLSPSLPPNLLPFFDRSLIKPPTELVLNFTNSFTHILTPSENPHGRCLKLLPFPPRLEDQLRATFLLTRQDLDKLRKRVLSKWDVQNGSESTVSSIPPTVSSFVLTCAYVLVCIAKAFEGFEGGKHKFAFGFSMDCRARLNPPIPDNYFGNCVWGGLIDCKPLDFIKEEGFVVVAKSIHGNIKEKLAKGIFHGAEGAYSRFESLAKERIETVGTAGSNRFGVYENDFGWGKPAKVEIMSVDRALTIGLAESKDGNGGIEVGLVLHKHVMDLFVTLFHQGLSQHH